MLATLVYSLFSRRPQTIWKRCFQTDMPVSTMEKHSKPQRHKYKRMEVVILPALYDNYMYLIIDRYTRDAAIVDPVETGTVLEAVENSGVNLTSVFTTHHHWDHAGGNEFLVQQMPRLQVYGGDVRIEALTMIVDHNTKFKVGNLDIKCLCTPGHTAGHICYYVSAPQEGSDTAVFTGDTLFVGGCGKLFEGTPHQLCKALIDVLGKLPDDTKVFCGHEYTLENLKFAAHVEPQNPEIPRKIHFYTMKRLNKEPTVPSTIAEEKMFNPFMRVTQPSIMKYAQSDNIVEVMKIIRQNKDIFRK